MYSKEVRLLSNYLVQKYSLGQDCWLCSLTGRFKISSFCFGLIVKATRDRFTKSVKIKDGLILPRTFTKFCCTFFHTTFLGTHPLKISLYSCPVLCSSLCQRKYIKLKTTCLLLVIISLNSLFAFFFFPQSQEDRPAVRGSWGLSLLSSFPSPYGAWQRAGSCPDFSFVGRNLSPSPNHPPLPTRVCFFVFGSQFKLLLAKHFYLAYKHSYPAFLSIFCFQLQDIWFF